VPKHNFNFSLNVTLKYGENSVFREVSKKYFVDSNLIVSKVNFL